MSFSVDLGHSNMQKINTWSDVLPFAARFVAYKTNSYYFSTGNGYVLSDPSIGFGYIEKRICQWSNEEIGFNMRRLLKPEEVASNCALTDSGLKPPLSLSMRLLLLDEITSISQSIIEDQAKFEGMNDKKKISILLERSLSL